MCFLCPLFFKKNMYIHTQRILFRFFSASLFESTCDHAFDEHDLIARWSLSSKLGARPSPSQAALLVNG